MLHCLLTNSLNKQLKALSQTKTPSCLLFLLQKGDLKIHTEGLVKQYGKRTVVNNVSFDVNQGEVVGLLGPNGAGKTTSFYMVVGLVKPDKGNVFLDGENITKLPMYKRAQMGIGYLPQEASIFRKLSVADNISAVLEMTKLSKAEQSKKLEELLDEFRLGHVRKSPGDVLSGGERRRTEIARALAVNPKFILLDEPFAGIDPIAVEDIQSIVATLKYKNIGILITDHNVQETLSITDRAYLLFEGRILKAGSAEELAEDEQVRKVYLGQNFVLRRKDYLNPQQPPPSKT
jgi:lipopolysaccharide export system ATP-binding protein